MFKEKKKKSGYTSNTRAENSTCIRNWKINGTAIRRQNNW